MLTGKEYIAWRVAQELKEGMVVNLGIGIPTKVADFLPEGVEVIFHSENGFAGKSRKALPQEIDPDLTNAGAEPVVLLPGAATFDSVLSFTIVRGGHLDVTVLGALEVDVQGNLANWMIPGKKVPGMGGAMDLVCGAKKVIVAMEHTTKEGAPKILERCTLPLTAKGEVDLIVTELAVIEVNPEGLKLIEISPYTHLDEVIAKTGTKLIIDERLKKAV